MTGTSQEEFDWIRIKQEIGSKEFHTETGLEKFKRKATDNPFVPIGALLTTACLSYGLWTMKTGERRMSQLMMRGRVVAQAFTLVALCGGIAMNAMKQAEEK
uniref:HIG1 domain family member 2A n=1 Tax=Lygus hesperus TaxID=30085 RepID=A0A0A9YS51_LYGHE